jgi:hypothetical protein
MQIHEITQRRIDEGMWDGVRDGLGAIKTGFQQGGLTGAAKASVSNTAMAQAGQQRLQKQAAKYSDKLTAQGHGADYQPASSNWKDKYAALQKNPAVNSYAKNIAAAWIKKNQTPTKPSGTTATKANPGQMSSTVAASKTGQNMQQMFGQPKGGIQGMQSDLEEAPEEYTTPGGIIVPAGVKTDVTPGSTTKPVSATTINQNKNAFVDWSDKQLATRVPETGDTVTMDVVRQEFPDLDLELNSALTNIAQTQGTPAQATAIEKYIKLATAGVQAKAQQLKNKISAQSAQQGVDTANTALSAKQALQSVGINSQALQKYGAAAKDSGKSSLQTKITSDPYVNNLLQQAGWTLTR